MADISGTLLTRQWRDGTDGLVLRFWLHTSEGPVLVEQSKQEGVFFIENTFLSKALHLIKKYISRTKPLALKSFSQQGVTGVYFTSQQKQRSAANLLKDNGIEPLESDVRTVDRYLMERFITLSIAIHYQKIEQCSGYQSVENVKLKQGDSKPSFKVISFDIETSITSGELFSIAVYGTDIERVFIISETALTNCVIYKDETDLLLGFMAWMQAYDPDILIGWNCINFDLRFLEKVCKRLCLKFSIGRNHEPLEWRTSLNNTGHYFVLVPGRVVLDGIDTLKSATYHFESFSLESVSRELLGQGKLIHDPDDRGAEIVRLFKENKQGLADYNLEDCALVWQIFEHTDLIQFAIERANLTGLPMDKVGGSVAAFENQYLPRLHRKGYVAPNLPLNPQGVGSPGGYVMDSKPGFYENVLVLDFKSLYPSIIRSFKIDPYGLVEGDRLKGTLSTEKMYSEQESLVNSIEDFSPGFNGSAFKKKDSILPSLIERLWLARDNAKRDKNMALSQSLKIIMNSFYGVMGTPGCRFFDPRLPSSITLRGHNIMLQTRQLIEEEGYFVIYGDTDSIFVWLDQSVVSTEAEAIGKKLVDKANQWWQEHLHQKYQLESALELEYESHYTKFLMPTLRGSTIGSKKRYAGLICYENFDITQARKEDYQLIFKGLENVRTDWTRLARDFQKELYERIFLNKEYKSYIRQIIKEVKTGMHDNKLYYRKRLRRKLDDYKRNVPPHVQAARKVDAMRYALGKEPRYNQGGWIKYYYTVNGPEPSEYLESSLDYELYLERQISPIVDGIVTFLGTSYREITTNQMNLI